MTGCLGFPKRSEFCFRGRNTFSAVSVVPTACPKQCARAGPMTWSLVRVAGSEDHPLHSGKTKIAMGNGQVEDVFAIEYGHMIVNVWLLVKREGQHTHQ